MAIPYEDYIEARLRLRNKNQNTFRKYLTENGLNNEITEIVINAIDEIPYYRKYPMYEPTLLERFIEQLHLEEESEEEYDPS